MEIKALLQRCCDVRKKQWRVGTSALSECMGTPGSGLGSATIFLGILGRSPGLFGFQSLFLLNEESNQCPPRFLLNQ